MSINYVTVGYHYQRLFQIILLQNNDDVARTGELLQKEGRNAKRNINVTASARLYLGRITFCPTW